MGILLDKQTLTCTDPEAHEPAAEGADRTGLSCEFGSPLGSGDDDFFCSP